MAVPTSPPKPDTGPVDSLGLPEPGQEPPPRTPRFRLRPARGSGWTSWLKWVLIAGVAFFVLLQAVPYGRSHTNPPTTMEPKWDSPQTRSLAQKACFDCHSNLTKWPWYTNVAPMSWLVQRDVDGGRASLNFSEWNKPQDGAGDVAGVIQGGSMPPWFYTIPHPSASLSQADQTALMNGLAATFRNSPPIGGG